MDTSDKKGVVLNRVVSFLAGGLVVFAVMSATVVSGAKKENVILASSLDTSKFEAGRLLSDAKASFANRDFEAAQGSLTILFAHQPGSAEAVEGKKLLVDIDSAVAAANAKWDAASAAVQKKWFAEQSAELRAQSDKDRSALEAGMNDQLNQQWEKEKDAVRKEWEAKS